MTGEPPRTLRRRGLFILWSVLATTVLLELVLQVGARLVAPKAQPGATLAVAGAFRVLAVGDSWVAGAEAPQGEGFVDGLARGLTERLAPRAVQVVNRGQTGANSAHVALTILDDADTLRPDLILVLVGQNNASNFARVAEVEERVGANPGRTAIVDRLRVVKLVRILWANVVGGSDYDRAPPLPTPALQVLDAEGKPTVTEPRLLDGPGRAWALREPMALPLETGSDIANLSWALLHYASRRELMAADGVARDLAERMGWSPMAPAVPPFSESGQQPMATMPIVDQARSSDEVLARYALLRWAREENDWRSVRMHGGALLGVEPRDLFTDLGGAEAAVLAGDWRLARALLVSARHRAPGLWDVVDLALRFPVAAKDTGIDEAAEMEPLGTRLMIETARVAQAGMDWEAAKEALAAWVELTPFDEGSRADLATLMSIQGDVEGARRLMGVSGGLGDWAHVSVRSVEFLRWALVDAGETGDRALVKEAVDGALAAMFARVRSRGEATVGTADTVVLRGREAPGPLLGQIVQLLGEHGFCENIGPLADRWFLTRGDPSSFSNTLVSCFDPSEAAARIERLRPAWGPLGDPRAWQALVRSGHQPFQLLYRDLDLVSDTAKRLDSKLLVLSYPSPSEDHQAIRDALSEYAQSRPIHFLDLQTMWKNRFDLEHWRALLGPNGHCNAEGYALMAQDILAFLTERGFIETGR